MSEDRLLERLEKLEGVVETTVAVLPPLIQDLSRRIDALREEVKAELREREARLEERFQGLGKRIQEVENRLEAQILALRQEMKAEIGSAFNRVMLYLTALGVVLALLSAFFR